MTDGRVSASSQRSCKSDVDVSSSSSSSSSNGGGDGGGVLVDVMKVVDVG